MVSKLSPTASQDADEWINVAHKYFPLKVQNWWGLSGSQVGHSYFQGNDTYLHPQKQKLYL